MNEFQANCPTCGKPVAFHGDFAMSSICESCGAILVRPGYGQSVGQVANLPEPRQISNLPDSDSPLEFGMRGRFQGHDFDIRGVVRLQHDAGGFWDEWYLLFDDGRCGWLAEVQQRLYLTFPIELKGAAKIPDFNELNVEQRFLLRTGEPPMKVVEKGTGRPLGARGEIPYALAPQKEYQYADLSGPGGRFATIDYEATPPTLFFGRAVALGDLHLSHRPEDTTHEPRHVEALKAACPHCHAGLTVRVPHKTVRVGCTACGSLLDAEEGRLQFARTAAPPPAARPHLPIGAKGQINGVSYSVIGYLKRCDKSDATSTWDEYLLYDSQAGYRWLTCSDDHWYFVTTVPPGNVELQGKNASYLGKTFRWFEQDIGLVSCVLGEFYWKVDPGEQVWMTDYLCPPEMLSREITHGGPDSGELSWSRAVGIAAPVIEQAFGLRHTLPRPVRPPPTQPSSVRTALRLVGGDGRADDRAGYCVSGHRCQQVFHKTYLLEAAANRGGSGPLGQAVNTGDWCG